MRTYSLKKNIIWVILLISAFGCQVNTDENTNAASESNEIQNLIIISQAQFNTAEMKLGELVKRDFHESVNATGMIKPSPGKQAVVSATVEGYIKSVSKLPGDWVKQGDVLASLENIEYLNLQQEYLTAMEKLKVVESNYKRIKSLSEENISSKKELQQINSEYQGAKIEYEGLKKKLELIGINAENLNADNIKPVISIDAPISGFISSANLTLGQFAGKSDVLFEIIDSRSLILELKVFEKDISKLKPGQEVQFKIPENNSKIFKAKISFINKAINLQERTVQVWATPVSTLPEGILSGMFVDAEIINKSRAGYGVPENAVISNENESFLIILKENADNRYVFLQKPIQPGVNQNAWVEIIHADSALVHATVLIEGAFDIAVLE
ncbi:MAG: efflux RND transporter periplasmic adaptor subunit [Bacteroidales bacterium]|nr:efflux RND transporter periplasmic adaptor subunit [Bacteroidales bacterium]MBN2818056.1 efflux RND transporter periplasmic adaptor subunit [Bacteroidales bacterium]